jgi:hypothetical protein|tara:strand:- start:157 stop:516 length:360 start_codon:yes stop_codon:yes gene_type:complete
MKVIFKVEEYLAERNSMVIKTCRLHSHKPIDDYSEIIIDCDKLNLNVNDNLDDLVDNIVKEFSISRIDNQDEKETILESNIPEDINEFLDFNSMVGKVFMGTTSRYGKAKRLKMRRIEL